MSTTMLRVRIDEGVEMCAGGAMMCTWRWCVCDSRSGTGWASGNTAKPTQPSSTSSCITQSKGPNSDHYSSAAILPLGMRYTTTGQNGSQTRHVTTFPAVVTERAAWMLSSYRELRTRTSDNDDSHALFQHSPQ
jgi:hypothetical protein